MPASDDSRANTRARAVDIETASELIAARRIRPNRHLNQIIWALVVLAALALLAVWVIRNPAFEWDVFATYFTQARILEGLWNTIWITAVVVAISVVFGLALAAARLSRIPVLVAVAWGYVWVFRSVPVLVQLLLWFNIGYFIPAFTVLLPGGALITINTNDIVTAAGAAILGLSLHGIALAGEIIRGGILGVPTGQTEAAQVLGLSDGYTLRRIVFPQALRSITPALANMFIEQLKGTSIVSVLAVKDLLYSAQEVYATNYKVVPLLIVATVWYIVVTSILSVGQYFLERRLSRSSGTNSGTARGVRGLLSGPPRIHDSEVRNGL
jgi:polar amino acid transport system permease protein